MDLITYVPDLVAFRSALTGIVDDESHALHNYVQHVDPEYQFNHGNHIPVHYSGDETLSVCRDVPREAFEGLEFIQIIGEVVNKEYVFDSTETQATYERVRGELEFSFIDEDGSTQTAQKPYKIGVFA